MPHSIEYWHDHFKKMRFGFMFIRIDKGGPGFCCLMILLVTIFPRSALTKLLCGLYALLLVVFGIVFAVANALTVKERQHFYYLEVRLKQVCLRLFPMYSQEIQTRMYVDISYFPNTPFFLRH